MNFPSIIKSLDKTKFTNFSSINISLPCTVTWKILLLTGWVLSFEVREWYCSNPLGRAAYRENNNESLNGFPCCEPGRSNLAWQQWNILSKESTFLFTSHWSVCFLLLLPLFFSLMDLHKYWDCRIAQLWNHSLGKTYLQLYAHTCTLEIHTNIYPFLQ